MTVVGAAVVSAVIGGCHAAPTSDGPVRVLEYQSVADLEADARAHGWDTQVALLADGVVTAADYAQAIDDTRACAEARANGITEPALSPIDNLTWEFAFPIGALPEDQVWAISDECSQQHLWSVQTAYVATHDAVMDDDIRMATLACMADLGHEIVGDVRNAREMAERIDHEREPDLADCIGDSAVRLRPDLASVGVSW